MLVSDQRDAGCDVAALVNADRVNMETEQDGSHVTSAQLPTWPHDATPSEDVRATFAAEIQGHFSHVFNEESMLRIMTGKSMVIELTPDAGLFAVTTARPLPYSWRENIKKQLDDLLAKDIIAPVDYPTDWCHPMVPIPNKNGGIRMCVDLTRLNKYVRRLTYPMLPTHVAVKCRPSPLDDNDGCCHGILPDS